MSRENRNTTSGNKRKNQGTARNSQSRSALESRSGVHQRSRKNTKRKRRKQAPDYRLIALVLAALMFLAAGVFWVSRDKKNDSSPEVIATTETTEAELEKTVSVDGVLISGMSLERQKML